MFRINKKTLNKGFTLIETFVAITVLLISAIGPLSLLSKSISDGKFAQNQIIASYLAQEGLELVYGLREEKDSGVGFIPYVEGLLGGNGICSEGVPCIIGLYNTNISVGQPVYGFVIYQDNNGFYTHKGNNGIFTPTIFSRKVWFSKITHNFSGTNVTIGIRANVQIDWKNKNNPMSFVTSTILYK